MFENHFLIKECLIILLSSLILKLCFDNQIKVLIGCTIVFLALELAIEFFSYMIFTLIANSFAMHLSSNLLWSTIISKSLILLLMSYIKQVHQNKLLINRGQWVKLLVFPIVANLIMALIQANSYLFDLEINGTWLLIIATVYIILVVLEVFLIKDFSNYETLLKEKSINEAKFSTELELYKQISSSSKREKQLIHDYKNQIACLQLLYQNGDYDELNKYLSELSTSLVHNADTFDTHNSIINAVINSKYKHALDNDIACLFTLDNLSNIVLSDYDAVVILSNLLDNAIEACLKLNTSREITLKIDNRENNLLIACSNTYDGNVIKKGGKYKTTKDDTTLTHGLGLSAVIDAVNKYHGSYSIVDDNNLFKVVILLPQQS